MRVEKLSSLVDYIIDQSAVQDEQKEYALSFIRFITINVTFGKDLKHLQDLMFCHFYTPVNKLLKDDTSVSCLVDTDPNMKCHRNIGFVCTARDESFKPIPLGIREHENFAFTLPLTPRLFKRLQKECSEYELRSFRDSFDVKNGNPRNEFSNNALRYLHFPKMTLFGNYNCNLLVDIKEDQEYLNILLDVLPQIKNYKTLERCYDKIVNHLSFACFKFPLVIEL